MSVQRLFCNLFVLFGLTFFSLVPLFPAGESALAMQTEPGLPQTVRPQLVSSFGKLPLSFEANQGQTDRQVQFLSRGRGYTLFLTPTESVMVLQQREAKEQTRDQTSPDPLAIGEPAPITQSVVRMKFEGANPEPAISGKEPLPGIVNYFVGKDPAKWRTHIPTFQKVEYNNVYSGIDLVYYGNQRQLEFDFIVAPGADPKVIRLKIEGTNRLEIDPHGDLLLHVRSGYIQLQRPRVHQEKGGVRQELPGHYVLNEANEVSFQVASYDVTRPLVIDPTLVYSTYLGGSSFDEGNGIAVDAAGAAYVTGSTQSADFTASCTAPCLVVDSTRGGFQDAFVTKLNATGTALLYSTYLGGSASEAGIDIAVDAAGAAYVTGSTNSADFTASCTAPCLVLDSTLNGFFDAFVTKLNATGTALLYSTYLGGGGFDDGRGIAVDAVGAAYVTGRTQSFSFTASCTAPCTVLDSTLASGSGDAFVTKLNATGTALLYSTYLGGNGFEEGRRITVDAAGVAYVSGTTESTNFTASCTAPCTVLDSTLGGLEDAFVTKLNATGTALRYSTYLGGSSGELGSFGGIAVDAAGAAYVTGFTTSADFTASCTAPCTVLDSTLGGEGDAFVTKIGEEVVAQFLIVDEDSIDNGTKSIEAISFNPPFCGGGNPSVCVNDDIANPGVRTLLFTRPTDVTPLTGLVLPTGQVGDEGLFRFTNPDPQMSEQNGATFTTQEFFAATGMAADENNLDKIAGTVPLGQADIEALTGKTVCAVVYDSDISVDRGKGQASLKGATMGVTAFKVTAVTPNPAGGSYLPDITVDLLPSAQVQSVCQNLQPTNAQ